MKKTLITLAAATVALGSANAQLTLGGTTFNPGDQLTFASAADFFAGTNATLVTSGAPLGLDRDDSTASTFTTSFVNRTSGFARVQGVNGSISYDSTAIDDFYFNDATGAVNIVLGGATLGFAAGDFLSFANAADFFAGTNATLLASGVPLGFDRDDSSASGFITSFISRTSNIARLQGVNGNLAYDFTAIDDFFFNDQTGLANIIVGTSASAVPEPSSALLLGLSALGFMGRRKRS